MEHRDDYFGFPILVVTTREPDGSWRYTAEIPGTAAPRLSATGHPTEEEARRAALGAAMEAVDRLRQGSGKP